MTCWPAALGGPRAVQGLALQEAALGSPWLFPVQLVLQLPWQSGEEQESCPQSTAATGGHQSHPTWPPCNDPGPELRPLRSEDLLCAGSRDVQEPPGCIRVELILVTAQRPHVQHTQHLVLHKKGWLKARGQIAGSHPCWTRDCRGAGQDQAARSGHGDAQRDQEGCWGVSLGLGSRAEAGAETKTQDVVKPDRSVTL